MTDPAYPPLHTYAGFQAGGAVHCGPAAPFPATTKAALWCIPTSPIRMNAMSQENDDDLMSGAPFQPVTFTAASARKWCERRKIDFSKVIKWELRDYGPNALVVVMAVRIDENAIT